MEYSRRRYKMAQIYNTYDSTLKEKVFIVKGEEGYARSTDTLLEELERRSDWDEHFGYMLIGFHIDVLRDVGASYVVLYDNGEAIGTYEFDTNTHSIDLDYESTTVDNRVKLNYGVEHNIYAVYMGNKQCMKSQSKTYTFYEPIPDKFEPTLTFDGILPKQSFPQGTTEITFDAVLTPPQDSEVQTSDLDGIKVYLYDNNIKEPIADGTIDDGTAELTIDTPANGIHSLYAFSRANDYVAMAECREEISVGYNFQVIDYPPYTTDYDEYTVTVSVSDYYDDPVSSNISFVVFEYIEDWGWEQISPPVTSSGETEIEIGNITPTGHPKWKVSMYSGSTELMYHELNVPYYGELPIHMTFDTNVTAENKFIVINGEIEHINKPVTVQFNSNRVGQNGELTTDANGKFNGTYRGSGIGYFDLTATLGSSTASESIRDYLQYWLVDYNNPSQNVTLLNQNYTMVNGQYNIIYNGFELSTGESDEQGNKLRMDIGDKNLSYSTELRFVIKSRHTNWKLNGLPDGSGSEWGVDISRFYAIRIIRDVTNNLTRYYGSLTISNSEWVQLGTLGLCTGLGVYLTSPNRGEKITINNVELMRYNANAVFDEYESLELFNDMTWEDYWSILSATPSVRGNKESIKAKYLIGGW